MTLLVQPTLIIELSKKKPEAFNKTDIYLLPSMCFYILFVNFFTKNNKTETKKDLGKKQN